MKGLYPYVSFVGLLNYINLAGVFLYAFHIKAEINLNRVIQLLLLNFVLTTLYFVSLGTSIQIIKKIIK
jgi:hypothetical protein